MLKKWLRLNWFELKFVYLPEKETMTQDERWIARYKEVVGYIETNQRNVMNESGMKPKRVGMNRGV